MEIIDSIVESELKSNNEDAKMEMKDLYSPTKANKQVQNLNAIEN